MNPQQQIKQLREKIANTTFIWRRDHSRSMHTKVNREVSSFYIFFYQFFMACVWVWQNILSHVLIFFRRPAWWLWGKYRELWHWAVYSKNEFGDFVFSKTRAGIFLAASISFLYVLPTGISLIWDTTLYTITLSKDEVIYLSNSQEIYPDENIHSVQGCIDSPCTDQNSIYFRIRPSLFNHLWAIFHNDNIFYPDFVSAAIPPGLNRCVATSFGIRIKFVLRGFDIYPDLLRAECVPVTQ